MPRVRAPAGRGILQLSMTCPATRRAKEAAVTRIIILAVAATLVATTGAQAAARKAPKAQAWQTAAVAARPITPARPSWAGPNDCFTDDGYGRFWPCSGGPCGR